MTVLDPRFDPLEPKTPTLRDQFAMFALAGYMAYPGQGADGGFNKPRAAEFCYAMADAMLAARQPGAKP